MNVRTLALAIAVLALSPAFAHAQSTTSPEPTSGRRVEFPLEDFDDTLFAATEAPLRVAFDDRGHLWMATPGGVIHMDPATKTRELYTKTEGLPSSYSLAIAIVGGKAYVGTDLGVAIIDTRTGLVQNMTRQNSQLPDDIVTEVAADGEDVWFGTQFFGVARFNTTRSEFTSFKNTSISPNYAQPVTRIHPTPDDVWIGTRGDGAWNYDRANDTYTVMIRSDGLAANDVYSILDLGARVFFGTDVGLQLWRTNRIGMDDEWHLYNKTTAKMPDDLVRDVDLLRTESGRLNLFAATRRGLWTLDLEDGRAYTRVQSNWGANGTYGRGPLGTNFFDVVPSTHGIAFSTTQGLTLARGENWTYYGNGLTRGRESGPLASGMTSASVDNSGAFLWFGTQAGPSAYRLPTPEASGYWRNFGARWNYSGGVINFIDTADNVTWMATSYGVVGFDHRTGEWYNSAQQNVYGIEADRGELWVGQYGINVVALNLTTGIERIFSPESTLFPIPDNRVGDIRIQGDDVWMSSSVGLIRVDRVTGQHKGSYGTGDGLPGDGNTFRALPDGPVVWVGTARGGVAKFDIASRHFTTIWNHSHSGDFPACSPGPGITCPNPTDSSQVLSLHREGPRLWVGTKDGLVRIDLITNQATTFTQRNSGLVQNVVNGITSADGILYAATLSGVARYDLATETWLPMRDGPGVIRGVPGSTVGATVAGATVSIQTPRDGSAIAGETVVRGTAYSFTGTIDRVEVRVGGGDWQTATGTDEWTFTWDPSGLPLDKPVILAARAYADGEVSRVVEHLVTPVAPPKVPLTVEGIAVANASAFRPFQLAARATGDDPLEVVAYYRVPGARTYQAMTLTREGSLFSGAIPAREMREGNLSYYFRATSGRIEATSPDDLSTPFTATVVAPPRLGVLLEAPANLSAPAGTSTRVPLTLTNAGTQAASFGLTIASGLRTSWVNVPSDELQLAPGESRTVNATIQVPPNAADANVTFTFEARDSTGAADPASVAVPVRVMASPDAPTAATTGAAPVPGLSVVVALALAFALALARRRRA